MTTTDLTDRYHLDAYMDGGTARWALDRAQQPVAAVILHHTAGWYGRALDAAAPAAEEVAQVDALARDHRARFGIGPGYHYLAFPSGRLYAVGKWGTQRAHTTGRDPTTGERWNVQAVGVCAFGNFEAAPLTTGTVTAVRAACAEVNRIARRALPVIPHGETPRPMPAAESSRRPPRALASTCVRSSHRRVGQRRTWTSMRCGGRCVPRRTAWLRWQRCWRRTDKRARPMMRRCQNIHRSPAGLKNSPLHG